MTFLRNLTCLVVTIGLVLGSFSNAIKIDEDGGYTVHVGIDEIIDNSLVNEQEYLGNLKVHIKQLKIILQLKL